MLESKTVLVVSTVMVPMVPSMICAHESLLPLYRKESSLCELCLRKLRHRIISSVVDCRLNPLAIRISSVVDCLLIAGRCCSGGGPVAGRLDGLGSLEEQLLESGDLICPGPLPAILVDCRLNRPLRVLLTGLTSLSVDLSGLR